MTKERELVRTILTKFPETRDDDFLLYGYVCYNLNEQVWTTSFGKIVRDHKKLGMPSYETITRMRRSLQEKEPALRGQAYAKRKKLQEEYRQTYGGNN